MIFVHPNTLRTIFGRASERLIINSNALNLRVDRLSLSSSSCVDDQGEPSSFVVDDDVEELGGGKMNAPCRLPLPAGNGRPTVGVGLQSTGGRMRASRNESKD